MLNRKVVVILIGIALLSIAMFFGSDLGRRKQNDGEGEVQKIIMGGEIFSMEVVSSADDMARGLGGRKELCGSCGMLFEFPEYGQHNFWMKGMLIPLDIIWVKDGEIMHVQKNIDKDDISIFSPKVKVNSVLEFNAGTIDRLGAGVGDQIEFK